MNLDELCYICIDIMRWWANNTPLTYGEINVWLFVIIQPILILLFIVTTIYNSYYKNKTSKFFRYTSFSMLLVLFALSIMLVLVPYIDIMTDIKAGEL